LRIERHVDNPIQKSSNINSSLLVIAHAYLNKVREELLADGDEGELIFDKFIKALIDSEDVLETDAGIKELYTKVSELFRGRSDLLDPFVSFLQPGEALTCGKAMENIEMGNMTDFLIKAEVQMFL
jgi:histone deacetylase complex regulatory component SIN3